MAFVVRYVVIWFVIPPISSLRRIIGSRYLWVWAGIIRNGVPMISVSVPMIVMPTDENCVAIRTIMIAMVAARISIVPVVSVVFRYGVVPSLLMPSFSRYPLSGISSMLRNVDHQCAGARDGSDGYTVAPSRIVSSFSSSVFGSSCLSGCHARRTCVSSYPSSAFLRDSPISERRRIIVVSVSLISIGAWKSCGVGSCALSLKIFGSVAAVSVSVSCGCVCGVVFWVGSCLFSFSYTDVRCSVWFSCCFSSWVWIVWVCGVGCGVSPTIAVVFGVVFSTTRFSCFSV